MLEHRGVLQSASNVRSTSYLEGSAPLFEAG
jgi:hypothetical protein